MLEYKIILTDCDGVLLDWNTGFNQFMEREYGIQTVGDPNEYCLYTRFEDQVTPEHVEEFNSSDYLQYIKPFKEAQESLKMLSNEGWRFLCITAVKNKQVREKQLRQHFGNIWTDIICVDNIKKKEGHLIDAYNRYGSCVWVEDNPALADIGEMVGHQSYLIAPEKDSWQSISKAILNKQTKGIYYGSG